MSEKTAEAVSERSCPEHGRYAISDFDKNSLSLRPVLKLNHLNTIKR